MRKFILLLFLSTNCFAYELAKNYEEAKVKADQTESVTSNKKHQSEILVPYFGKKYSTVLQSCFKTVDTPDDSEFDVILAIDKNGDVKKVYRNRETNIARCMIGELEKDRFPKPIIAPFYIHFAMSFTG